jgi:preprotein translocase subunit SecE
MEKFKNYVKLSRAELTKVIFPLKEQVKNAYLSVFLVVTIVTLFLALIDAIMSFSLSGLLD